MIPKDLEPYYLKGLGMAIGYPEDVAEHMLEIPGKNEAHEIFEAAVDYQMRKRGYWYEDWVELQARANAVQLTMDMPDIQRVAYAYLMMFIHDKMIPYDRFEKYSFTVKDPAFGEMDIYNDDRTDKTPPAGE